MSNSKKCQSCDKKATVHLTQIVKSKVEKVDLCGDCAVKSDMVEPGNLNLLEMFGQNPMDVVEEAKESEQETREQARDVCPGCGQTITEFKTRGRFGCPSCYTAFAFYLRPMLREFQLGLEHHGKAPLVGAALFTNRKALRRLRREKALAVKEERYMDAARIDDRIKTLEAGASGEGQREESERGSD